MYDMGNAVQESLAFLVRRNLEHFAANGIAAERIISSGGGASSKRLCQLKADVTQVPVDVPQTDETVSLGAAIIGCVADGAYRRFASCIDQGEFKL